MSANCMDKILCENAWDCNITVCDIEGNPIDPFLINNGDSVIFVVDDKPGYVFTGWVDENNHSYFYTSLGNNRYRLDNINCSKKYFAQFRAILYNVSIGSSSEICGFSRVVGAYYGDIVQITATENPSCHFLNWTKDGEIVTEQISFSHVVTENVAFIANYDVVLYRLTVKPDNSNRGRCEGSGIYAYNTTHTIRAIAFTGYVFEQWDDGNTNATRIVTLTENKTYIASFSRNDVNVVVPNVEGGSSVGSGEYKSGSVVSLQAIPDEGWKFDYWLIDGVQYTDKTYNFVISNNKTVLPYFSKKAYYFTCEIKPTGAGYFDPSPLLSYEYGDTAVVEAKPNSGYRFVEWEDGFSNARRELNILSDMNLVAYFTELETEYTLTIDMPDSTFNCAVYYGYIDVGTKNNNEVTTTGTEGTIFEIAPVAPVGKQITTVTKNNVVIWDALTSRERFLYTMEDSDATLVVNAELKRFSVRASITPINNSTSGNITLNLTVGGTTETFTPTTQNPVKLYTNVEYGTNISMIAPSTIGSYNFVYWRTDIGSFSNETITFSLTQQMDCYAVYSNEQIAEQQNEE